VTSDVKPRDLICHRTVLKRTRMRDTSASPIPIAHVAEDGRTHALIDHLKEVGRLAGQFASVFGSSSWAEVAGLWHDLGKYSKAFQDMIRSASGLDAHIETAPGRVDHSTAGAIHAVEQFGPYGNILAYLIAGHHAGLPDWNSEEEGRSSLYQRLQKRELLDLVLNRAPPEELLQQHKPKSKPPGGDPALWIRMLFSCLTDADFLDTEAFMDPGKAKERSSYRTLAEFVKPFESFMKQLVETANATPVNRVRGDILRQCQEKAHTSPGIFSLTVPTGGGKTLSSFAFALRHAIKHDKRRIIYVIPYTSIIEQTADIFRKIFGEAVVEHHSNLDSEQETPQSRLACENWDAPLVVTTSVQFFESLFASRTSRARRLHSIVNSVVVLDEAQLLPPEFLKPILSVMEDLHGFYDVSFILSTATQPALKERKGFDFHFPGLREVVEIIDDPVKLHDDLKRVEIVIPDDLNNPRPWEEIAAELGSYPSVLCIVNRRDDCRELFRLMPPGTIHLSALMCGEHRVVVIANIRERLKNREPLRVVSTQLVEAGVKTLEVIHKRLGRLEKRPIYVAALGVTKGRKDSRITPLVFLGKVEKSFDSFLDIWKYLPRSVRHVKDVRRHRLGDLYPPTLVRIFQKVRRISSSRFVENFSHAKESYKKDLKQSKPVVFKEWQTWPEANVGFQTACIGNIPLAERAKFRKMIEVPRQSAYGWSYRVKDLRAVLQEILS